MAKILISSLGTGAKEEGGYLKAKYKLSKKVYETSFIADALVKHLEIDKIFLVGTNKSIWDEAYLAFGGENEDYHESLYLRKEESKIDSSFLEEFDKSININSKSFIVDYGINEDELWSNFEKFLEISKYIEDGDELYLDITHSFRSLALMSFVMTQFASSISEKNFKIAGVYYGMFEHSSETEDKTTPIVDIKILLEIQEWIKAIDAIKKYSDFDLLVNLLDDVGIEKNVTNTFIQLNNTIEMSNMAAMKQFIQTASKKISLISNSENKIVKLLAPEISKLVDELNHEKMSDFQFALAKWFYRNKNYASSYLALSEGIITKTCEIKFPDEDSSDKDIRNVAKGRIDDPFNKEYSTTLNNDGIAAIRHNIAHQLNDRKDKVKQDIEKLSYFLNTFESYFRK